jgi:hypothetical protein
MIKKTFLVLLTFFIIQLIISCIFCTCDDAVTYEVNYNSVEITPMNTAGFSNEIVNDSVYKNAFGISILIHSDHTLINSVSNNYTLGFSTALACSCEDDTYIYPDPVSHVYIFIIDTETNERTNVTDYFGMPVGNNEHVSLKQFFNERAYWHDGFQFELVNFNPIPNSVIFVTEAYLESGKMFTNETKQINFIG